MNKITADILDYLGKYENGVLVLLTIGYKDTFTEGTIYYSDKMLVLTVDPSIEQDLGSPIELWPGYQDLLILILKKVVPYNEIINRLDDLDASKYSINESETDFGEEIDGSEIN